MQLSDAGIVSLTCYHMGDNYEIDESLGNVKEKLYLGGGYYHAPAVLIKQGGNSYVYFINRDYPGSILQITDAHIYHYGLVTGIGFSHPMVQNLTQNAVHKYMTPTPYFLNYDEFKTGGYFYSGYRNPHSLW